MKMIKTPKQMIESLIQKGYSQREIANEAEVEASAINRLIKGPQTDMLYMPGKRIELFEKRARKKGGTK